jgi:hypothetical protein
MMDRFEIDLLDPDDPFEIDTQAAHLFKHGYSPDDLYDMWCGNPLFYPADQAGSADWLLVGEVPGDIVLVAPLAPSRNGNYTKARPVGLYQAPTWLEIRYRNDRR